MAADAVELYLIRHAPAESRGEAYPDDAKRPLTERGKTQMRRACRGLAQLGIAVDAIVTSPYVRAWQTAEIVARAFDPEPSLIHANALAPGAGHQAVLDELAKHGKRRRLALVGHEPDLGQLAAKLVGARNPLEFKKGAVCRIDVGSLPPSGPGVLRWFVTSRILRKLRR